MISLVATGFGPYPGAPENPTEWLMRRFAVDPPDLGADVAFQSFVLPTEYAGLGERLTLIGGLARPDIAVHFGLSRSAHGFRLEGLARNRMSLERVDARGSLPQSSEIAHGRADIESSLPLQRCLAALKDNSIAAAMSDDCGDYLCNALFFHSRAGLIEAFRPVMSGFIHVPLPGSGFTQEALEKGARLILAETVAEWRDRHKS